MQAHPTVMVADCSADTRHLLKFWLEMNGCHVVEAANGQEAFELTSRQCPDLILMSEIMPILGGFEATRRIRQRGVDCVFPIVAMSTYPTIEAEAIAFAAGCCSFISQPIDLNQLSTLLKGLLPGCAANSFDEN